MEIATSKLPSAYGSRFALAAWNSMGAPASETVRARAMASMLSLRSTPETRPSRPTSAAISAASSPGPQPMSSTRSPGWRSSARSTSRRCSTTSGVR
ncbi:hypothetical protein LZC94_37150 [Pendulispora albinea]|uniref:Uncharacterized protein n=1 Tax=Pendulispora albinea TaxID=2741071 RepID=A0ABZ2LRB7_9BACT